MTRPKASFSSLATDLKKLKAVKKILPPKPIKGWIAKTRENLDITAYELAARVNITQSVVSKLEQSERDGTMKLNTLKRMAQAMGCDLFYVFIPTDVGHTKDSKGGK